MTFGISSDFNSSVRQLQGLFNQFGGSSAMGAAGGYVNSIFNVAGSVGMIAQGNDAQKAQGIQNLVNEAMSLLQKILSPEAEAQQKVTSDAQGAGEVKNSTQKVKAELKASMAKTEAQIDAQTEIAKNATETIENAKAELQKKQEEINKIIEQEIQTLQKQLAAATEPEEKLRLLGEIGAANAKIAGHLEGIESYQTIITNAETSVTQAYAEIEAATAESDQAQAEAQTKITTDVQKAAETTGKVVKTQADGVKNESLGAALEAAGAAEVIIPFVGAALSSTTIQKGTELIAAGGIEILGSVTNIGTLFQGISEVKNNSLLLSKFTKTIGGALNEFNGAIGGWNTTIESTITSLGSLTGEGGYKAQSEQLNAYISEDYKTLGVDEEVGSGLFSMKDGYSVNTNIQVNNETALFAGIATKVEGIFEPEKAPVNTDSFDFAAASQQELDNSQSSLLAQNPQDNTLKTPTFEFKKPKLGI